MQSKRGVIAGAVVLVLVAAALYFGPHWTIYRMRQAMDARDATAFSSHVDFPALRDNFKGQLMVKMGDMMKSPEMKGNAFAGLGQMIAVGMIPQLVDAYVSPAGVMAMMDQGAPKLDTKPVTPSTSPAPEQGKRPSYGIRYVDWSTAVVRSDDAPAAGGFVFRRDGLFAWKLAAVELPTS